MKLILRNFLSTMRYYRQSSLFNIIGLSLAFMACYIIYVQTAYEFGFGKVHNDYERIHRVDVTVHNSSMGTAASSTPLLKKHMLDFPIVEHTTLIEAFSLSNMKYNTDAGREFSDYELYKTDTCLNDVFDFDMVAGTFDDIAVSGLIMLNLLSIRIYIQCQVKHIILLESIVIFLISLLSKILFSVVMAGNMINFKVLMSISILKSVMVSLIKILII